MNGLADAIRCSFTSLLRSGPMYSCARGMSVFSDENCGSIARCLPTIYLHNNGVL